MSTVRTNHGNAAPISHIPSDLDSPQSLQAGIGLCLSGGGYRAMLFHLGGLIRLNEAKLLSRISRVSSVSGGSITAGLLGMRWNELDFQNGVATRLMEKVVDPIRMLSTHTIDVGAIIGGVVLPGSVSQRVAAAYEKHLFGASTLQAFPSDSEGPRFVINATNVQSGALWRFSRPYMADYLVGQIPNPRIRISLAVAASSAFPPVLSPLVIELNPQDFIPDDTCPLQKPPFTSRAVLSDGGVYDNLGLETVWKRLKTILVSDGGGRMQPKEQPHHDWPRHAIRILDVVDNQVRSLRKRQLIGAYQDPAQEHDGTYWGIRTHIKDYQLADALPCPEEKTQTLANIPTRLKALDTSVQEKLINWGYAVCDAAVRKHVAPGIADIAEPKGFPFPGGVG